ncbi:MAG: dihydrolipoyl dehydrogenase [Magnetococcales bacterium]|nr:dihydrolipoyl dehydrogenase [Magnetococcales bacterium]
MNRTTPLVVLGGGPGGYTAAFLAAEQGIPTLLLDADSQPGGVCLQRGCIPSKALLQVARLILENREAARMGLHFAPPAIDLAGVRHWKEAVVQRLMGGLAEQCRRRGVTFLQGQGRLLDAHTLLVSHPDGREESLSFDNAILATGSRPAGLPGLDLTLPGIMDSTQALALERIPRTLLVVGGGTIGLELGTVYAALGSAVSVVEKSDGLLPGADRDLLRPLAQRLARLFASVQTQTQVTALQRETDGIRVTVQNGENRTEHWAEALLVATGRLPNSQNLGLEKAGIALERGFVTVGADMRSSVPHILAIGDLIGGAMLAHKAAADARRAVATLTNQPATGRKVVPVVTYTDPELAYAGLTESAARQQGIPVKAIRFPWAASGRAHTLERTEGLSKWIIDPPSERVLGVGIVGAHAGELLAYGVQALEQGLTIRQVAQTLHPHPTLSETLQEAAELSLGESVHYYAPRRERSTLG